MDTYIKMVNMLLNYIYFLRTGNWKRYLDVLFDSLPYCFHLNRQSYAQNLSYYYVYMQALWEKDIAPYKYLEQASFSSSLTGKAHYRIYFDQVIKMTISRSCKDVVGLSGKTQDPGAMERWTKVHHYIVALSEHLNKKIKKVLKKDMLSLVLSKLN